MSTTVTTSGDFALLMIPFLVSGLVALAIWLVVVPLGLRRIFEALGTDRRKAWIPFVNVATVFRLGGRSEFWLIALVIPFANVVGAIMLFVATHRINKRLGRSGWYTVLAVVAWWVWALALGLQSRVDMTGAAEPLVWSAQQRPQTSLVMPGYESTASLPPHVAPPAPPLPPLDPPAQPLPPVDSPAHPGSADRLPAPAPFTSAPATPPSIVPTFIAPMPAAEPVTPAPIAPVVPPAPTVPPAPAPAPAEPVSPATQQRPEASDQASAPDLDNDATVITSGFSDATVVSARRRPRWWVRTTMGARVELTGMSAILGRRPSPHPLYPNAQLIAVTDDSLSVSATHAVLEFVDGEWQVTDLDSTNGVWLIDRASGEESELGARNRARVTETFMLGELGVQVVQSA